MVIFGKPKAQSCMKCDKNIVLCGLFFIFSGLSNGTFLGLSALKQLYLSHNEIERIESGHFSGLDELEVLRLDNNHISWIGGGLLGVLSQLRVLTLHSNLLLSLNLDLGSPGAGAGMQLVTIHDNRWQCSSKTDCTWITQTVDTLNKSAVKYLNKVKMPRSDPSDAIIRAGN